MSTDNLTRIPIAAAFSLHKQLHQMMVYPRRCRCIGSPSNEYQQEEYHIEIYYNHGTRNQ